MLAYIQRYLARLRAESHDMQKQLHDINEWIVQHPQESDPHHCASITIDSTNPIRQHLRDDHPPTIPSLELKIALDRAICRNKNLHRNWEVKKRLVQERVSVETENQKILNDVHTDMWEAEWPRRGKEEG